jgi:hypothetical protein
VVLERSPLTFADGPKRPGKWDKNLLFMDFFRFYRKNPVGPILWSPLLTSNYLISQLIKIRPSVSLVGVRFAESLCEKLHSGEAMKGVYP